MKHRVRPPAPKRLRKRRLHMSRRGVFLLAALLALLLLLSAVLFLAMTHEDVYEANMARAQEAMERADWDRALRHLRLAAAHEQSDDCLLLMASCYENLGNLDKALELLRRTDPANTEAAQRIRTLEEQKAARKTADRVEVLGSYFPPDTTLLDLSGRGLRDGDLEAVTRLYALDSLSLADNSLSDLSPLRTLGSLDVLDLSRNRFQDLSPLAELRELRSLTLDGNPLGGLVPLYELPNLRFLSLRGCALDAEALRALAEALPACAILSDANSPELCEISLGGTSFLSDVRELNLSGRGIRDISVLAICKELQWLNLSGNEISELQGLMNLPRLSTLDISRNQVADLRPLIGIATLKTLKAADNAISDVSPLSAMGNLQTLDLSGNDIADFSTLRRLTSLTALRLDRTGLKDIDLDYLAELSSLSTLSIEDNIGLSNEAYGKLQSRLRACRISHSQLVYTIRIENRSVHSDVMQLDLSGEGIIDLTGIERLNNLESLNLSRNRLSNLFPLSISASRSTLKTLNLSFNELYEIDSVGELYALENLNLYGNPLKAVAPLLRLSNLKTLNVGGCGLSDEQLQSLRDGLPDCAISLEAG